MPEVKTVHVGVHVYHPNVPDSNSTYGHRRTSRLGDQSLDQVLLLATSHFDETIDRFGLNTPYWRARVFRTCDPRIPIIRPRLTDPNYSGLTDLLTNLFPAEVYNFWGAELKVRDGNPLGQCVLALYNQLDHPGKQIEVDACRGSIQRPVAKFLKGDFRCFGPWGTPLFEAWAELEHGMRRFPI